MNDDLKHEDLKDEEGDPILKQCNKCGRRTKTATCGIIIHIFETDEEFEPGRWLICTGCLLAAFGIEAKRK